MKIGFVQFQPVFCDTAKTILKLKKLLENAGSADLFVLPELANAGYNFESREQAFEHSEPAGGND